MSHENPTAEQTTASEEQENNDSQTVEPTIEDLQKDLETWKGHARTWENRAKENKNAADQIKAIEDANKSELERAQERLAELEAELNSSKETALRSSIIAEFALDPEDAEVLLTASDEAGLRAQAERLAVKNTAKAPKVTVNNSDLENHSEPNSKASLARNLLGF